MCESWPPVCTHRPSRCPSNAASEVVTRCPDWKVWIEASLQLGRSASCFMGIRTSCGSCRSIRSREPGGLYCLRAHSPSSTIPPIPGSTQCGLRECDALAAHVYRAWKLMHWAGSMCLFEVNHLRGDKPLYEQGCNLVLLYPRRHLARHLVCCLIVSALLGSPER